MHSGGTWIYGDLGPSSGSGVALDEAPAVDPEPGGESSPDAGYSAAGSKSR